jgi:hypothetical protein
MNSIEAIIALSALMLCFGIIIFTINAQKSNQEESTASALAKIKSLECAAKIDSLFSNSGTEIKKVLKCTAKGKTVSYSNGIITKNSETLLENQKSEEIGEGILEHYK